MVAVACAATFTGDDGGKEASAAAARMTMTGIANAVEGKW